MKDLKTIAMTKINDFITYMQDYDCSSDTKKELYYACSGKIHLAFELGLINRDERKALLKRAAECLS